MRQNARPRDHVKPGGAIAFKAARNPNGIVVVDGHLVVTALMKADDAALEQIDRRN